MEFEINNDISLRWRKTRWIDQTSAGITLRPLNFFIIFSLGLSEKKNVFYTDTICLIYL